VKRIFLLSAGALIVLLLIIFALPGPWQKINLNWGIMATVLVILCIVAFFFEFERSAYSSKEIVLISMLATISAVMRIPFAAIPGVQPCTYLITCSGYVFGPVAGFMVGAMTPFISNFFLGHGPWTPYQMLAWGLIGAGSAYLRRFNPGTKSLTIIGLIWGYAYGVIINIWFWASFIYPLTATTFVFSMINSIWFDTLHAVGNAFFLNIFGTKTISILERFKKRFHVEYRPENTG
jgi:energy-coupling factor transport system substrate-specific component